MRIGKCKYCRTEQHLSKWSLLKSINIKVCGGCGRFLGNDNTDIFKNLYRK